MGKVKVKVRNSTSIYFKIEVGRDGVYGGVEGSLMRPNGTFRLEVDEVETYKAYRLVRVSDNTEVQVYTGSELINFKKEAGFKEMVVKMKEGSDPEEYTWEPSIANQNS